MLNKFRVLMNTTRRKPMRWQSDLADRMRARAVLTPGARQKPERVSPAGAERTSCRAIFVRRGFDIGGEPTAYQRQIPQRDQSFQVSQGVVPDGFAISNLLERLRQP